MKFIIIIFVTILLAAGAIGIYSKTNNAKNFLKQNPVINTKTVSPSNKIILEGGKSLDWGKNNNLVAVDLQDDKSYWGVHSITPDGLNDICLTCTTSAPRKHKGNPTWSPDGRFVVFTAQKDSLPNKYDTWAIPGSGLGNDLWAVTSDGKNTYQLTDLSFGAGNATGVIHPQFSPDGRKIVWTQRLSGGGAWGLWDIWVGEFRVKDGYPTLSNIKSYTPGEQHIFYETHDWNKDGVKFLFSGNLDKGVPENGLDIYEFNPTSGELTNLTKSPGDWDEHAHYTPDGKKIVWMSSKGININWQEIKGRNWAKILKTELWIMDADGNNKTQLTRYNDPDSPDYLGEQAVVSDNAISPDGKQVLLTIAYRTKVGQLTSKQVLIDLP